MAFIPGLDSIVKNTVGKTVDKLLNYLPISEEEKQKYAKEASVIAIKEYEIAMADVESARELAMKESEGTPQWTKVLTVTHRPIWSFVMLSIFCFTIVAPVFGLPQIPLTDIHKDIMQTVIIFYFGGRSIEKSLGIIKK